MIHTSTDTPIQLEVIGFQPTTFFDKLTELVESIRSRELLGKHTDKLQVDFEKLIFAHTGLNCNFDVEEHLTNAYAYLPQMNNAHQLLSDAQNKYTDNAKTKRMIRSRGESISGSIDLKHGKVGGVFSEFKCSMVIGGGILYSKDFTAKEAASILLHELGHLYTIFERMDRFMSTNAAIESHLEAALFEPDQTIKTIKLKELNDELGTDVDVEDVVASTDKDYITTTYLTDVIRKGTSGMNSKYYDATSIEYAADEFAIRYGAGSNLSSALQTLSKKLNQTDNLSMTMIVLQSSLVVIYSAVVYYMFGALALLCLYLNGDNVYSGDTYDRYVDRNMRIRNQLITQLKDTKDSKSTKEILAQLDRVKNVMDVSPDRKSLANLIFDMVGVKTRNRNAQKKYQKALENMFTNELYVKADLFKNLK